MIKKTLLYIAAMYVACLGASTVVLGETVTVFYDASVEQIKFAVNDVKVALESKAFTVEIALLSSLSPTSSNKKIVIALASDKTAATMLEKQGGDKIPANLGEQAYALRTSKTPQLSYWVLGGDINGAMYGGLQVAENIKFNGFSEIYNSEESPDFLQRGAKLNLPLDRRLPTYSGSFGHTSGQLAIPAVWDMAFWREWIDEQARNRYNVLSVWVHHPFLRW